MYWTLRCLLNSVYANLNGNMLIQASDSHPPGHFQNLSTLELPFVFIIFFSLALYCTSQAGSRYGFTALLFLHVQGQAINCMKTIQSEQDAEKLPTQLSKGFVMLLSRCTLLQAEELV